jgi:cation transport ATPase
MITLAAAGIIGALLGAVLHNLGAFVILINSGRIIKLK